MIICRPDSSVCLAPPFSTQLVLELTFDKVTWLVSCTKWTIGKRAFCYYTYKWIIFKNWCLLYILKFLWLIVNIVSFFCTVKLLYVSEQGSHKSPRNRVQKLEVVCLFWWLFQTERQIRWWLTEDECELWIEASQCVMWIVFSTVKPYYTSRNITCKDWVQTWVWLMLYGLINIQ